MFIKKLHKCRSCCELIWSGNYCTECQYKIKANACGSGSGHSKHWGRSPNPSWENAVKIIEENR